MGTELQAKYQKLAQEYAKLRSHVDILKKAVRDEKAQKSSLEEGLREKSLSLRKHVQENESLEFRNQQLSKRVSMLQDELSSPSKRKKKGQDGFFPGVSEIHTQELAAKISENERLHMKILELTQKSERNIQGLQYKVDKLEREVTTHHAGVEELNREHRIEVDTLREKKAMLEVKHAKQTEDMLEMRLNLERLQTASNEWRQKTLAGKESKDQKQMRGGLLIEKDPSCASLNVPVVDTKLQAEVLVALKSGMELISTFTTQLSTFHSYLEQRCKSYPIDVSSGLHISTINQKLCELLHSSSSYTRPLVRSLSQYCDNMEVNPFSTGLSDDLYAFSDSHHKFVSFLETLTPYLQLSLAEENNESICGSSLLKVNQSISDTFPLFTGAFSSMDDYIHIIITGQSEDISASSIRSCLERLNTSLQTLQDVINKISTHFSDKITLEAQLPVATQKLITTNECVVSALGGILSTANQLCSFLQRNEDVFGTAIEQTVTGLPENKQPTQSTVVQNLRIRATNYLRRLKMDPPPTVPYTLAVHNSLSLSTSTESNQTLMKQVTDSKERLSRLEQEKEMLTLDLQLLTVKYEKEHKKSVSLESQLSHVRQVGVANSTTSSSSSPSLSESNNESTNKMPGSVSILSASEEENVADDTEMIRKHFVQRITELNDKIQDSEGKTAYYYTECRALHKQLGHSTLLRNKLTQDMLTGTDTIQQLQDELGTTSSNYEKQLSTMSDHLCEINDRLISQSDELDMLKKSSKGKKRGK